MLLEVIPGYAELAEYFVSDPLGHNTSDLEALEANAVGDHFTSRGYSCR